MRDLPEVPGAFDEEFLADLPYSPEVLFFDRLLEVDREKKLVRCRMPTDVPLPLTESQRHHPVRHPKHVAGAILVHATGMLGFVHAYYLLGLRHRDGWIGYGTHLHNAVFRKLVEPGAPLEATCRSIRQRLGATKHFVRYAFEFRRDGVLCYESEQSAFWHNVEAPGVDAAGVEAAVVDADGAPAGDEAVGS